MPTPLRRRIRHARRFFGYGLLVVLILAAALVGSLNQLLPLVERHPDKVADWLSERIGEPVSFRHARGEWTRRGPLFTLDGLRIGREGQVLDIGRAELLVSVYSGLLPGEPLTALKVRELSLRLEQGADGRWRMAGLPFQPQPGVDPLDTLEALGELQLEHARLAVSSPALSRDLALERVDLRLRVGGDQLRAGVRAWADTGTAPVSAVVDLQRSTWSGRLWAGGQELSLDAWSPLLADTGLAMAGQGDVDLWARIDSQRVMDVRSRARFLPLALSAHQAWHPDDDGVSVSPAAAFQRVDLLARWQVDDNGWQLHAPQLRFVAAEGGETRAFDGLWLAGGKRFALQAPRLDLGPARTLAVLSDRLPTGLRRWLQEAAPEGRLAAVRVSGQGGRWSGSARFEEVAWQRQGGSPGLQGLSGNAAFDQSGGVLRLVDAPARFDWSGFRQALDVRLDGTLAWWRQGEGWAAGAGGLSVQGEGYGADVRAELAFAPEGRKPRLDLAADVKPAAVPTAGKFWVVGKMPPATIDWLDQALLQGQVEQGRAVLAGDLGHWPFRGNTGRFDARAHVTGARVAFNAAWPEAEDLDMQVSFDGPGMALEGSGTILGNRVEHVAGGIADFKDPRLELVVDSPTQGETLQALMLASPLRERYEEHLLNASVRGPADVHVVLDLPLAERLGERHVEGTLDLREARLADPRWQLAFDRVTGRTRFSDHGFATEDLAVEFDGLPAVFNLAVGEPTGDPALAAVARLAGEFPPQVLLARHEPLAWLGPWLQGRSAWTLGVEVPQAAAGQPAPPARLSVDSDLVGTAITLPAPLAKDASTPRRLRLAAPLPISAGAVEFELGDVLRFRGRTVATPGAPGPAAAGGDEMAGTLHFGPGPIMASPARGLVAEGQADALDVAGWIAFAAQGDGASSLQSVDLQVATLDLLGSPFADTRVRLQRQPALTRLQLAGPAIEGEVEVPATLALGVKGRFARLHWPDKPEAGDVTDAAAGAVPAEPPDQDPTVLPPLDFSAEDLRIGGLVLGKAVLKAVPREQGLRIEQFDTASPTLSLKAAGDWLQAGEGRTRSIFTVDFTAGSLGELLDAFGLAGMVEHGRTEGRLDGQWSGSPGAFSLTEFNGSFKAEVGEGQLLEVEPGGGGRMLGLISLAEIPRRLTLDFSDFFEKGFGFNTMSGEFIFADGRASTDLLLINGPAAEIRVSGSTDLRRQEYDQRIEVLPKAGGVLPAIGAIAGGPVGAAVGAVAQAVLQKPLKQAARTVYRVTGPWSEPQVDVVEKGPPPTDGGGTGRR